MLVLQVVDVGQLLEEQLGREERCPIDDECTERVIDDLSERMGSRSQDPRQVDVVARGGATPDGERLLCCDIADVGDGHTVCE